MRTTHVQISNGCSQMVEESTSKEQLFNHLLTLGSVKYSTERECNSALETQCLQWLCTEV